LVVNVPAVPVVPFTVVGMFPPVALTATPDTAVPLEFTTVTVIFPPVAIGMSREEVAPALTATVRVCARNPLATAVMA
jgi:hypothetical protein